MFSCSICFILAYVFILLIAVNLVSDSGSDRVSGLDQLTD